MKIYLSVALAAILASSTVSAQHSGQKVAIGVKGGVNIYNVNTENDNFDSKVGFNLGVLGHIHLAKQLALQPEIVYSQQGAKTSTAKLNLNYVNVPVLLQYMFDNGFRLQAGPQVGFLVSAKSKVNDVSVDVKDDLKSVDFALGAGIGYVHPASGFGVDARYNFGLSNINKDSEAKSTNRGAQIGVFYLINHRNK